MGSGAINHSRCPLGQDNVKNVLIVLTHFDFYYGCGEISV